MFNDLGEVSHDLYVDAKVSLEQQFLGPLVPCPGEAKFVPSCFMNEWLI